MDEDTCVVSTECTKNILISEYNFISDIIFVPEYKEIREDGIIELDPELEYQSFFIETDADDNKGKIATYLCDKSLNLQKSNKEKSSRVYFGKDICLINQFLNDTKVTFIDVLGEFNQVDKYIYYEPLKNIILLSFESFEKIYLFGRKIYYNLSNTGYKIFVPMYRTIGDPHKTAAALQSFDKKENVRIGIVILSKNISIASLFNNLDKIFVLSYEELDALLWYIQMRFKYAFGNIRVIGAWGSFFSKNNPTSITPQYSKDLTMFTSTIGISRVNIQCCYNVPILLLNNNELKQYKNAVLLNPYANTLYSKAIKGSESFQEEIWNFFVSLSSELCTLGINVFTNVSSVNQKILPGTKPLNLSVLECTGASVYFKCIISVMTGLVEALVLSGGRACVLFPNPQLCRKFKDTLSFSDNVLTVAWSTNKKEQILKSAVDLCIRGDAPIDGIDFKKLQSDLDQMVQSGNPFASLVSYYIHRTEHFQISNEYDLLVCLCSISCLTNKETVLNLLNIVEPFVQKDNYSAACTIANIYETKLLNPKKAKEWAEYAGVRNN